MTVDVLIPAYKPDERFARLLGMLSKQTCPPEHIIVINTEKEFWRPEYGEGVDNLVVKHISRREFDHGAARNLAASLSTAEILVFMTDDAVPADERLLERLVAAFGRKGEKGQAAAQVYARQLPASDCGLLERFTREFNYPPESQVKTAADLPRLGIKTYFASNVCCAYRRELFVRLGGFPSGAIFNEDMIFAAGAIQAGFAVVYAADARVIHSHNLTPMQQFHRNFDMAVSQADHPEVFAGLPSEGEGLRLVKQTARRLLAAGRPWLLADLVISSGMKYAGYRMGKAYRRLPRGLILWCSMSPMYWKKQWREEKK